MSPKVITVASGGDLRTRLPAVLGDSSARQSTVVRVGTFTVPRSTPSPHPASQPIKPTESKILATIALGPLRLDFPWLIGGSFKSGSCT